MTVHTHWLAGRRALARVRGAWLGEHPGVAVELGSVQPIVATINDDGTRFVGVRVERGNVYVELQVADPEAFRAELDEAITWRAAS